MYELKRGCYAHSPRTTGKEFAARHTLSSSNSQPGPLSPSGPAKTFVFLSLVMVYTALAHVENRGGSHSTCHKWKIDAPLY